MDAIDYPFPLLLYLFNSTVSSSEIERVELQMLLKMEHTMEFVVAFVQHCFLLFLFFFP